MTTASHKTSILTYLLSVFVVEPSQRHVNVKEWFGVLVVKCLEALLLLLWGDGGEEGGEELGEFVATSLFKFV